MALSVECW